MKNKIIITGGSGFTSMVAPYPPFSRGEGVKKL